MKDVLKFFTMITLAVCLTGCLGNASTDNTVTGQVKKAQNATPLLLPDYSRADISLGVMRNGVGSMSTEDMWFYVPKAADFAVLKSAAETGAIVKITYNTARARFYVPNAEVTSVTLEK